MEKTQRKKIYIQMRRSRMKRKRRPKNNGAPKWMVTYSDMITLVLVFFILLFSMSQIDTLKFEQVTESFQSRAILDFLPFLIELEENQLSSVNEEYRCSEA